MVSEVAFIKAFHPCFKVAPYMATFLAAAIIAEYVVFPHLAICPKEANTALVFIYLTNLFYILTLFLT